MPITIADVAARAKVSKTTVSRVLNGKGELDESTAARVRKVIEELGYVPSSRAVGLAQACAPGDAVAAGWLDEVVEPDAVVATARSVAASLAGLDAAAHAGSKIRARATVLADVRRGIDAEFGR